MFDLEPHVALAIFTDMLSGANVTVFRNAQADTVTIAANKESPVLQSVQTTDGRRFAARVFIDASYEGDLMARAGVDYRVGRESRQEYDESLNGYRLSNQGHEFSVAVDPYGADGSLLPMLMSFNASLVAGQADDRVQSYNFRLCVTQEPSNRVPFIKPAGYDPAYWELARRYFTDPKIAPRVAAPCGNVAGYCGGSSANPKKHDLNNGGPISTDYVGGSWK